MGRLHMTKGPRLVFLLIERVEFLTESSRCAAILLTKKAEVHSGFQKRLDGVQSTTSWHTCQKASCAVVANEQDKEEVKNCDYFASTIIEYDWIDIVVLHQALFP
jgi:hypothetical protein